MIIPNRSVSLLTALSDLERWHAIGPTGRSPYVSSDARTVCPAAVKFGTSTYVGKGVRFYATSHAPYTKSPSAPKFWDPAYTHTV